ncbi:MAG: sugar transferase, partial [Isosphaeraceae bacterium]
VMFLVRVTSRGPVFYTQERVGWNGRCFTIYKIRTMKLDSEPNGPKWCVPGDPRVTLLGRFLRLSHLDELPQLVNILQGDMALIGPRPERPEIVARLERVFPDYQRRHLVRPGLTGLAQVLQAPDTDLASVHSKLRYDLYYLDHRNFWLDLRILLATVLRVLAVPTSLIALLFQLGDLSKGNLNEAAAHETSFVSALPARQ